MHGRPPEVPDAIPAPTVPAHCGPWPRRLPDDQVLLAALDKCLSQGCDTVIAFLLRELPTVRTMKAVSHLGMVEVPSRLARTRLVFIDEMRTASGAQRRELLRGPSVFVDAGTSIYALVLRWLLWRSQSQGPLVEATGRLEALSDDHQGDVIEATLAHLRVSARAGQEAPRKQLYALEALLIATLESLEARGGREVAGRTVTRGDGRDGGGSCAAARE